MATNRRRDARAQRDGSRRDAPRQGARRGEMTSRDATQRRSTGTVRDLTRPIPRDAQLIRRRRLRWPLSVVAVSIVGALVYAMFAVPYGNWRRQQGQIDAKRAELAVLSAANDQLAREVARLQTPEGAEEAARAELAVLAPGEHRVAVLPGPTGPLPLPAGWPYDTVAQIVAVRALTPAPDAPAPGDLVPPTPAPAPADDATLDSAP